jgi:hypothetical protein
MSIFLNPYTPVAMNRSMDNNKRRKRKPAPAKAATTIPAVPKIKLRLDRRTVITVKDQAAVERWRERYPELIVIGEDGDVGG